MSVQTTKQQSTGTLFVTHQRTHQNNREGGGEIEDRREGGRDGCGGEKVRVDEEGKRKSQPETKAERMSEKRKIGGGAGDREDEMR